MGKTVAELAEIIGGTVEGDGSREITGINGLREADAGDISFLANPRYAPLVGKTAAAAVVVGLDFASAASGDVRGTAPARTLIRCKNPDAAFARIAGLFSPPVAKDPVGVHPSAVVDPGARLGPDVSIQALVVIEAETEIGQGTVIRPGVFIGRGVRIGGKCLIYPNVTIREGTLIGDRVIVHAGAVIGADGFGYTIVDGRRIKIPQIGRVVIEDDVEIGANVTVDRARFGQTVIARGVKIDNLVQIAHNVRVGEDSVIVSLCAIAGSTTVGKNCVMGGQAAVAGHLTIGDNVTIGAKSGVSKDVPSGSVISGFPAQSHADEMRMGAELRRLAAAARRKRARRRTGEPPRSPGGR